VHSWKAFSIEGIYSFGTLLPSVLSTNYEERSDPAPIDPSSVGSIYPITLAN
jgi:hypothetical protein